MLKIFRRGWRLGAFWNENRGGPWGGGGSGGSSGGGAGGGGDEGDSGGSGGSGGPRNPWGQPPRPRRAGGGGPGGSLDDLLRRGRDRFGGRFPPSDGRPYWLYGLIAFLLLWVLFTSVHRISPQERGVVTTFGRFSGTLSPGIGFSWPAPFGRVQKVDVRLVREFTIPRGESENLILTGDKNVIDLTYSVRWTVSDTDPQLYLFQMDEPDKTIEEVAESAMRSVVSRMTLDEAIGAGRSDIGERVRVTMQEMLTDYGVGVTVALVAVNRSAPPAPVNQAFLQVSAAQQEAQRYINDARAYALQLTARAQGEATAFDRIYAQYRLAPEVTRRRMYYETMERILSRIDSTIIEAPGITPYLPLPEIGRQAQPQAQPPAQGQTQGQAAQQPQQQQGGR